MINGNRIRQARELARITQIELANDVGIVQSTIAHIEGGLFQPSQAIVEAIAQRLGFPTSFFEKDDPPNFPLGSLLFRSHRNLPAAEKAEIHRLGQLELEIVLFLLKKVRNKIALRLPQVTDEPSDYISAAQLTRNALGLSPDVPIANLVKAAEQSGIIVLTIPIETEHSDAYSLWVNVAEPKSTFETKKPLVVLSSEVPGDRLRLSLAHEIGHLVMHQTIRGTSPEIEAEAYKFAAELLLPEASMRQQITTPVTLTNLAMLKPIWGISMQALILRAHNLELINERQYRYLNKQVNTCEWREHEPIFIPSEKPRALRQMVEIVYGNPINYQSFSRDLGIHPHYLKRLIGTYATKEEYSIRSVRRSEEVSRLFS